MDEVACIALEVFFQNINEKGGVATDLTVDVSYPLDHLRNPHARIDWPAYVQFCRNAERYWSPEDLAELGGRFLAGPSMRWVAPAARLLFSVKDFYRWITVPSGPTGRHFHTIETRFEELSPTRLKLWAGIKEGYEPCPAFFHIVLGNLRRLPCVLGFPPATVEADCHPREATYYVELPPQSTKRPWLRRTMLSPFTAVRSLAQELTHVYAAWGKSEDYRATLFEAASDGVFLLDDDGRILDVNSWACSSLGYSRHELLDMNVREIAETTEHIDMHTMASGTPWTLPGIHRRKDGSTFPVETRVAVLESEGRRVLLALARNVTERQRVEKLQQQILERTMQTQEHERQNLARELHDTTSQSLTSLLLVLNTLEHKLQAADTAGASDGIAELRRITRQSLDEVQRLVRGLRPSSLDDLGFVAAIEHLTTDHARAHDVVVDLQKAGMDSLTVPADAATSLYRIVQEALTNIARHADARVVSVVIEAHNGKLRLIVEDDGRGFDVTAATSGFGLLGMRERASLLGGELTIESSPERGTTVYVEIPLQGP